MEVDIRQVFVWVALALTSDSVLAASVPVKALPFPDHAATTQLTGSADDAHILPPAEAEPPPASSPERPASVSRPSKRLIKATWVRSDALSKRAVPTFFHSRRNIALLAVMLGALALLARRNRSRSHDGLRGSVRTRTTGGLLGAALLAWAVSLAAFRLAGDTHGPAVVVYVLAWEIANASLVAGALLAWPTHRPSARRGDLLALLGLSLLVRIVGLDAVPPPVHGDEISAEVACLDSIDGRSRLFGTGWTGLPLLHFAIDGLIMKLLGGGLWAARFPTVLVGSATVLCTTLLAAELFPGRLPAIAAGAFTATHHLFLHYTRTGLDHADGALAIVAVVLFVTRSMRGAGWPAALVAGTGAGILVQSYNSARAAPILGMALLSLHAIRSWGTSRRPAILALGAFLAGVLVALGPLVVHLMQEPERLWEREAAAVGPGLGNLLRLAPHAWVKVAENLGAAVRIHTFGMDTDPHYGAEAAYLHPTLIPMLVLGALFVAARPRHEAFAILLLWGFLIVGGGCVLVDAPLVRRTLALVPWYGLLMGAGFALAGGWASGTRRLATPALVGLLGLGAAAQVDFVLRRYPELRPADFLSSVGAFLARSGTERVQLFAPNVLAAEDPGLRIFAGAHGARDVFQAWDLASGTVIVSATHAFLIPMFQRVPGARVAWPSGSGGAWTSTDAAGPAGARNSPIAVITIPPDPAWPPEYSATVSIEGSRAWGPQESPLPVVTYSPERFPGAERIVISQNVSGTSGRVLRAETRSTRTRGALYLDGRPVAQGEPLTLDPVPHEIRAVFAPGGNDVLMLLIRSES